MRSAGMQALRHEPALHTATHERIVSCSPQNRESQRLCGPEQTASSVPQQDKEEIKSRLKCHGTVNNILFVF